MMNEPLLWFKASRDKTARDMLMKKYRTGLNVAVAVLALGIVLSFWLVHVGLIELPMYLIIFSLMYIIYVLGQIARLKKME